MGVAARSVCPICGRKAAPQAENAAYPFCSGQCKLVDLGRWLEGAYRVPGPPVESTNELMDGVGSRLADMDGSSHGRLDPFGQSYGRASRDSDNEEDEG